MNRFTKISSQPNTFWEHVQRLNGIQFHPDTQLGHGFLGRFGAWRPTHGHTTQTKPSAPTACLPLWNVCESCLQHSIRKTNPLYKVFPHQGCRFDPNTSGSPLHSSRVGTPTASASRGRAPEDQAGPYVIAGRGIPVVPAAHESIENGKAVSRIQSFSMANYSSLARASISANLLCYESA